MPSNILMLGEAWQRGLVPVTRAALKRAIELNGVAVATNLLAFAAGPARGGAPGAIERLRGAARRRRRIRRCCGEHGLLARRLAFLRDYQDNTYAARLQALVDRVIAREREVLGADAPLDLARAVTFNHARLLAIKDEYEVARLYSHPSFHAALGEQFQSWEGLRLHMAPPIFGRRGADGRPLKGSYGPWMLKAMRLLARMKGLRGTALDIFGRSEERRLERQLIADYETIVDELLEGLGRHNHAQAVAIARVPERIRGYGHVKLANLASARARWADLLAAWRGGEAGAASKARVIPITTEA